MTKSIILKIERFVTLISLSILLVTILFYFPIFLDPHLVTQRGNDLQEFFWPLIYYTKESIYSYHQIPLWNNLFFSGTPLLPDPQAPIFYLPNLLFLFFKNIDTGFIVSIFLHIYLAGISFYLLAKKGFNLKHRTSILLATLYIYQPKLSGFIEAGHYGLITSWGWLPLCFLSVILLSKKPTLKYSLLLSISLAAVFYTHILIFIITSVSITILFFYKTQRQRLISNSKYLCLVGIICFGLIAIAFLPQIAWQKETTRDLLLQNPDVYPKWLGFKEFIKASTSPALFGKFFAQNLDTEKTIAPGFFTIILAGFGFIGVKSKYKLAILASVLFIILISLNNISPIYLWLIKQNWYILFRVATRFWFLIIFILLFLVGKGYEKINSNFLKYVLISAAIIELLLTSWAKILKPTTTNPLLAPQAVYEFLSQDKDIFRVFCLNRCLSQQKSALYGLELADGYGTLQQKNYYLYSQQLSQSFYRNRYTLSIPPFEIFLYENLQPYAPALAAYRVKYVISNHNLKDKNLKLVKEIKKYLIYENTLYKNPPYLIYTPNFIRLKPDNSDQTIIMPEVYSKGWRAYQEKETLKITESRDDLRELTINSKTNTVDLIYKPNEFVSGSIITAITLCFSFFLYKFRK